MPVHQPSSPLATVILCGWFAVKKYFCAHVRRVFHPCCSEECIVRQGGCSVPNTTHHSRPSPRLVCSPCTITPACVCIVHFVLLLVGVCRSKVVVLCPTVLFTTPTFSTVGLQSMHDYSCVCTHSTFHSFAGRNVHYVYIVHCVLVCSWEYLTARV